MHDAANIGIIVFELRMLLRLIISLLHIQTAGFLKLQELIKWKHCVLKISLRNSFQ